MTKCGDLGEISNRNLQLGEIDLKDHTYRRCIDISSDLVCSTIIWMFHKTHFFVKIESKKMFSCLDTLEFIHIICFVSNKYWHIFIFVMLRFVWLFNKNFVKLQEYQKNENTLQKEFGPTMWSAHVLTFNFFYLLTVRQWKSKVLFIATKWLPPF